MREIKFRAWNPNTKCMIYDIEEINLGSGVVGEISNGQLNIVYQDFNREWKEANVMQYTGLHDKNGVEIYEGDVVRDGGIVKWIDDSAAFVVDFGEGIDLQEIGDWCDVIGNICENPELLNNIAASK